MVRPLPSRRARIGAIGLSAAMFALFTAWSPTPASARTTAPCSFDAGTHVASVTATGPIVDFDRSGANIMVDSIACGTVTTVDTVNLDLLGRSSVDISINMQHGKFAPGFTPEASGASEIEFNVTNPGIGDILFIDGTASNDLITVGDRTIGGALDTVIELNGVDEGFAPDEDVVVQGTNTEPFIDGGDSGDYISGQGTGVPGTGPYTGRMFLSDGPGADMMLGGNGADEFSPPDTPDEGDSYQGFGGKDFMQYSGRPMGVRVTLDDNPDDGSGCVPGPACEGDNVHRDIEAVSGGNGNDGLFGEAGNQTLEGGGGTNLLNGGPGNDVLSGGSGSTVFVGGAGKDTVTYAFLADDVTVSLDGVQNDGVLGNDNVHGDVETVRGGRGNDQLTGNAKANRLFGGEGNDTLDGGGGNDTLDGGGPNGLTSIPTQDGNDIFLGGPGVDTVVERHHGAMTLSLDDKANDRVPANPLEGTDNIHSDVENLVAKGAAKDHLTGSAANNKLVGAGGDDTLVGAGGNDLLLGGPGSDALKGGPGLDTASFAASTTSVKASIALQSAFGEGADDLTGIERLTGSRFGDTLTGSVGPNVLTSGAGGDTLKGLAGDDRLVGGGGNDSLDGGPDTDTCIQGTGSGPATSCEL